MKIQPFTSERGCLSYLLVNTDTKEAILIDPSAEVEDAQYLEALKAEGADLRYIIETHTHADHISSAPHLRDATGAKIVRHTDAPSLLKDVAISGGEELDLGTEKIQLIATPGHTNESISVYTGKEIFTGDALLIGGTGRTDFQLGDSESLYESLHDTLGKLPDETIVYPAHDYKGRVSTTIGDEKQNNPRFTLTHDEFIVSMDAHHPPQPELFEEAIAANSK